MMGLDQTENDYKKYRGKCKEMAEALCMNDSSLRLVRGWYDCPFDGKQGHWWCVDSNGKIIDPSVRQFPTKGVGAEYIEFNGMSDCSNCGKEHKVKEELTAGNYSFCCYKCYGMFVGVL